MQKSTKHDPSVSSPDRHSVAPEVEVHRQFLILAQEPQFELRRLECRHRQLTRLRPALQQHPADGHDDIAFAQAGTGQQIRFGSQPQPQAIAVMICKGDRIETGELAQGRVDLVGSARMADPDNPFERDLVFTPVAWDAIVLVTSTKNPVAGLSLEQIADIYLGRVTD